MNTLLLVLLFIFGMACAWGILKATNWLPVVLLLVGFSCESAFSQCAQITVNVHNSGASGCYYIVAYNGAYWGCGNFAGGSVGFIAAGATVGAGTGTFDCSHPLTVYAYYNATGSGLSCPSFSGATGSDSYSFGNNGPVTITLYVGAAPPPPTYYWNYCVTNLTGLPMQVEWVGSPTNSPVVNLGPGQYYCWSGSSTNFGFGGFTSVNYNPDGSATNISIWPPTGPNTTNSPPGGPSGGQNPGGPNGTGGNGAPVGPGAGVPGSSTNLTGNQYYQGVTNLQAALQSGFGYLGSLVGAEQTLIQMGNGSLLSISNGVLTLIGEQGTNISQGTAVTNQMASVTNQLAALLNTNWGGFSLLSSNLGVLNSNTVAGFSNLIAGWGGTNFGDLSGASNLVVSNSAYVSNAVFGWGAPYDYGGLTDVVSLGGSNYGYWFLNLNTNPFTGGTGVKGIDLDPRHSPWFTGFASYAKNIEVWCITLAVMWQIRAWMSKRLFNVLMTPGPSTGGGDVTAATVMIAKAASGTAIVAGLPLAMAAVAYNFANWPSYGVAYHPLSGGAIAASGAIGPYIYDAIDIVSYMIPLGFLGGAIVYLGVVWLALDAMVAGVMTRVRFYPF